MQMQSRTLTHFTLTLVAGLCYCDSGFFVPDNHPKLQSVRKELGLHQVQLVASAKRVETERSKRQNDKKKLSEPNILSGLGNAAIFVLSVASKKALGALLGWGVFNFAQ